MPQAKRRHWRNSKPGKKDIRILLLVPFYVLKKILMVFLRFMDFRYKIWVSIRTTNIIERVFREFLKAYKHNGYISNRKVFVLELMFSLVQLVNESWEGRPFKHFR